MGHEKRDSGGSAVLRRPYCHVATILVASQLGAMRNLHNIALFSARAIVSARLVRASASLQLGIPTRRLQRRHLDRGVVAYHGAVAGATAPLPAPC